MPSMDDVINALQKVVADPQIPLFHTYLDVHNRFRFRSLTNSSANRKVLDPAAAWFRANETAALEPRQRLVSPS